MRHLKLLLLLCLPFAFLNAQTDATKTIATKVANMKAFPGYFKFYWDEKEGKIWLEMAKWIPSFYM